jgi:hypothetical protein
VLPFYESDPDVQDKPDFRIDRVYGLEQDAYKEFQNLD